MKAGYVEVVRDQKLLAESVQMRSIKEIDVEKAFFQVSWPRVSRISSVPAWRATSGDQVSELSFPEVINSSLI
jgi:hypothetical protein